MKELTKVEEIILIAIWKLKDDAYGVKIRQYVSNLIDKEFTYGNLYSVLNQLTQKDYVSKSEGEVVAERRGRPRITYTITSDGFKALKETREMNESLWKGISKLAFDR